MKTPFKYLGAVAVLGLMTLAPSAGFAQDTQTTTTITSTGTISDWKPDAVAVKVDSSPTPVRYVLRKTTTYVDQNGDPISIETIRDSQPVTVYYHNLGGNYVADKVVVDRSVSTTTTSTLPATESTTVTTAPAAMPPTETTTTTTTATPSLAPPAINGVVTDAGEGHIDLRTAASSRPIHYQAHDATAYLDENGNPVPRKILTPGTPVTLFYEQNGDNLMATRVIVKNPAVLDR